MLFSEDGQIKSNNIHSSPTFSFPKNAIFTCLTVGIFFVVGFEIIFFLYKSKIECESPISIAVTGDVLVGNGPVSTPLKSMKDFRKTINFVDKIFSEADLVLINFEGTIPGNAVARDKGLPTTFSVGSDQTVLVGLSQYKVVANLANNHAMDFGTAGLENTMNAFTQFGLPTVGAGNSELTARSPYILTKGSTTIAVVSFTDLVPASMMASTTHSGVNRLTEANVRTTLNEIPENVDIVIALIHTVGDITKQNYFTPDQHQKYWSAFLVDSGVDVVIGHQPHLLQEYNSQNQSLVFNSLGVFLYNPDAAKRVSTGTLAYATNFSGGGLLELHFCDQQLQRYRLVPIKLVKSDSGYRIETNYSFVTLGNDIKARVQRLVNYIQ